MRIRRGEAIKFPDRAASASLNTPCSSSSWHAPTPPAYAPQSFLRDEMSPTKCLHAVFQHREPRKRDKAYTLKEKYKNPQKGSEGEDFSPLHRPYRYTTAGFVGWRG